MASTTQCPRCLATSPPGTTFCPACGTPLTGVPPAAPVPGVPPPTYPPPPYVPGGPGGYAYPPPPEMTYGTWKEVDYTKLGLLFLVVGSLLGWLPTIGFIGSLLALVGIILIILGRAPFGRKHARNTGIALVLYIFGFIATLVLAFLLFSAVASAVLLPGPQAQSAVLAAFNNLLAGAIVIGLVAGWSTLFLLWELLDWTGRALLLAAYATGLAVAGYVYAVLLPQLQSALEAMFAVSPPNTAPILALDSQITSLRLLQAIPALLTAAAAYLAWSRISSGKIPKRTS